jgi:hypothetical protein
LPLVWLILVVHFDLQIFPWIFEKIWNALVLFSGAWEKMIHERIWSKKFCDTVPLNQKMEI